MIKTVVSTLALSLASLSAFAQMSPVGLWKTIDDDSKKEKSLVRIKENNGVYSGTIEKLLDPTSKQDAVCDKCTDERKDKPVLGMTILRNLKQSADDKTVYDGGDIVDPNNGKVYRTRLKPVEDGKKLEMRGYIGPFYRTQVWIRVE
ncbi:DUF2147 domain-containing protein [Hydrogenophaga sp.]|uniref:DUF2147 domain-containing protein n=1 Tax=Hydrogenophaga sp. TaxID=1904254 RepID=UPI0025C4886D|nr:DUF2147 domain-containing protein [Hydrogenophaga sp.]MBT9464312.1 DUF2147 domain-containing protein [Hydrogenophaga sp.]MBT9552627.1 DUF2147 domain-containing protein [Hydrogenophaga sp.]